MASNSFGTLLTVTTFGESHGPAIGCVVDGCPPGLELAPEEFRHDLERRATGRSRHTSQRRETDEIEILSGVYQGRTTGTPIALLIRNTDARSKDYGNIAEQFRPGHADYSYWQKYGHRDPRGGGRSSARETTMHRAAQALLGENDFSAFRTVHCQAPHARRDLQHIAVRRDGDIVEMEVQANAFLHHMVRNIVGSLLPVGRGDRPEGWIAELLAGRDRTVAGPTAPSAGLVFVGPRYPAECQLPAEVSL